MMGVDGQRCIWIASHAVPLLSAENQPGGAARDHVGRRACPRPRNDLWHHGSVRYAQARKAVHAELWVDNSKLVHPILQVPTACPKLAEAILASS